MKTTRIEETKASHLRNWSNQFIQNCVGRIYTLLNIHGLSIPKVITDLMANNEKLVSQLNRVKVAEIRQYPGADRYCEIDDDLLPYLKRCVLYNRRWQVSGLQAKMSDATDLELREKLENGIKETEMFDSDEWF